MERCLPITKETWTFPIGCNGHVPDEYFPDMMKENGLYPVLYDYLLQNYITVR